MEWSIQEIARLVGTTSRTLRHYDDTGLLPPSRTGPHGHRYYDEDALVRLQRILLLRDLGLGLPQIAEILDRSASEEAALTAHVTWLRAEQDRLARQIAAVEKTLEKRRGGERLMAQEMLDGFDHTQHRDEVTRRWGAEAYARSDAWWRGLGTGDKGQWSARTAELQHAWVAAAESGIDPASPEAQAIAERHVAWLREIPGTPAADQGGDVRAYVLGLAEMYAADPRFAANYATSAGGVAGAEFVRDALTVYARARL